MLGRNQVVLDLAAGTEKPGARVHMLLSAASGPSRVVGIHRQQGSVNYLLGDDPHDWLTSIARYGGVRYEDLYPGIDLIFRQVSEGLEYDFRISAGADPGLARFRLRGVDRVAIDPNGDLLLDTAAGRVVHRRPIAYQKVGAERRPVGARYVLGRGGRIAFRLGPYDRGLPLVIDPIISFSTFFGGSGGDSVSDIAVDPDGSVYLTGQTTSADFPVSEGAYQPTLQESPYGYADAFVSKLDPSGSLVFSTYLGGEDGESSSAVAIDGEGAVYVTGQTRSDSFPTTPGSFQGARAGALDAFIAKLAPSGSSLVYGTYLGAEGVEGGAAIAVSETGEAHITGTTDSEEFPLQDPFQPEIARDPHSAIDAFVSKLTADGSDLVFSTYLGGSYADSGRGIDVGPDERVYVTGMTYSSTCPSCLTPFPTKDAYDGENLLIDAFLSKFSPEGALQFSTYLGGRERDEAFDVAVDASGRAHITGRTEGDFPLVNPYDATYSTCCGRGVAFASRFASDGSALEFSTYFGSHDEAGYAIDVDPDGNVYIAGEAGYDLDTFLATQPHGTPRDAFVAKFAPTGSDLLFATYLGRRGDEVASGVGADSVGNVYVTGITKSRDFPVTAGAVDTFCEEEACLDGFVTKIDTTFVDTTPPDVRIVEPTDGSTIPLQQTVMAEASDNIAVHHVEFFVEGSLKDTLHFTPFRTTLYAYYYPDEITIAARATDSSGNQSWSEPVRVRVDRKAPVVTIDSRPPSVTNETSASFEFSADEPATFTCSLDYQPDVPCSSPVTHSDLAEGAHRFSVVATDDAGNTGSVSANWDVDRTPPTVFPLEVRFSGVGIDRRERIGIELRWPEATDEVAGFDHYLFERSVDGGAFQPVPVPERKCCPANYSAFLMLRIGSRYDFRIAAVDRVGNRSEWEQVGFRIKAFQERSSKIIYRGTWRRVFLDSSYGRAFGDYVKVTRDPGARARIDFRGRAVAWIGSPAEYGGSARVRVDDLLLGYDPRFNPGIIRAVNFSYYWNDVGDHRLVVTCIDPPIDVDAIIVLR